MLEYGRKGCDFIKSDKKILVAFLLNLFFSAFEFVGGIFTGSVAIISDSIHDLGDSMSIGVSYALERVSKRKPDKKHTYGYYRYSVLGGVIQSVILLCGSAFVIYSSVLRLISPVPINYGGMIVTAIIGFTVNLAAAFFTSGGHSINQKAISLHMLEDVLGWLIVLIGAIVMSFTDWSFLDASLSILLAVFIAISSLRNLKKVLDIFLEKTPSGIDTEKLKEHLLEIEGVDDIHHLHIWSMDGYNNSATLHAVISGEFSLAKRAIKEELKEHGIAHATVECEAEGENCEDTCCQPISHDDAHHHHHHHHHH